MKMRFVFLRYLAIVFLVGAIHSVRASSMTFEAESGALGSDWAVSNSASPSYITITTDSTGSNPGSAARVAPTPSHFPLTAPANATINATDGVPTWRPLVTQADTTSQLTIMIANRGTPRISTAQSFEVVVSPLVQPQLSTMSLKSGQVVLQVNGAGEPDYQIEFSTNLVNWNAIFTANLPNMPFVWTNSNDGSPINFLRVLVGPPLP